jgi:hypothetical protein
MTLLMELHGDRDVSARFHLRAGTDWLKASGEGRNANALVYCAFEYRLALERIGLELFLAIRSGTTLEEADYRVVNKLKNIQNRIYRLVGNQREIDLHIEYLNILLEALGQPFQIARVDLGRVMRLWHQCSEVCHMQLSADQAWQDETFRQRVYADLVEVKEFLDSILDDNLNLLLTWAKAADGLGKELRDSYGRGEATRDDILYKLREMGVWMRIKASDGTVLQDSQGFEPGSHLDSE